MKHFVFILQFFISLHLLHATPPKACIELLKNHGSSWLSYSTLQKGLEYYHDEYGYIAFERRGGSVLVLSDPIASDDNNNLKKLIKNFLLENPTACFIEVSKRVAQVLSELGFYINEVGLNYTLDLNSFNPQEDKSKIFRTAANQLERQGYFILELSGSDIDWELAKHISNQWLLDKKAKELRFTDRPAVFEDEFDVRKFFLFNPNGKMIAFIFFDPVYSNGQVIGYTSNVKRYLPEAPRMFEYAISKKAIELFKAEGKLWLYTGNVPFFKVTDQEFKSNFIIHIGSTFLYKRGQFLYNASGLVQHKAPYRSSEEKIYFASKRRIPLIEVYRYLRIANYL